MRSAFRLFLVVACCATAAVGALIATAPTERAAFAAMPLLAGLALVLHFKGRGTPRREQLRELDARVAELSDQLQRERIESGNRIASLEARFSSLERQLVVAADVRTQHREDLAKLRGALAVHEAELDAALAGFGAVPAG